jgi:hypothetical protein
MKKKIAILFILLPFLTSGQTVHNFQVDNGLLVWTKIYSDTSVTFDKLVQRVKDSGIIIEIEVSDDKIRGAFKDVEPNNDGTNYNNMNTPIYVLRRRISGFILVEFKDGRYRVMIKNIMLTQKRDDGLIKQGEQTSLETFGLKRGGQEMAGSFTKGPAVIYDNTFDKRFQFKSSLVNKDW